MKTFLTTTALAALLTTTALADETKIDVVTGCAIRPIENSNAYQYVDPYCQSAWAARTGNEGSPDSEFEQDEEEEESEDDEAAPV